MCMEIIPYHKTNEEALTVICSLVKHLGSGRALKKQEDTRLHLVLSPTLLSSSTASCLLLQQNSQGFFFVKHCTWTLPFIQSNANVISRELCSVVWPSIKSIIIRRRIIFFLYVHVQKFIILKNEIHRKIHRMCYEKIHSRELRVTLPKFNCSSGKTIKHNNTIITIITI